MMIAAKGTIARPQDEFIKSLSRKRLPTQMRMMDDFLSTRELTPITNPIMMRIISHPNIQRGNHMPRFKFFNRRAKPRNTMIAPTILALLLLRGGIGGGVVL